MKNLKAQMIVYFLGYAAVTVIIDGLVWMTMRHQAGDGQMILMLLIAPAILAVMTGYYVGQQFQRKLDQFQIGLIQATKGNHSFRIRTDGNDPFETIYRQFNDMAAAMEQRTRWVQEIGEAEAKHTESEQAAVIEERKRLARDLHDTVSQQLFAMHMQASTLPTLIDRDLEKARPILEQLIHMSHLAQVQIRGLISQLRPLELEGRSLCEALEAWFPDYCRHNGLKGTLDLRMEQTMSGGKEQQLFMIVQEAMANIVKHASAKEVHLFLHESAESYVMQIRDDGSGFGNIQTRNHSYGLSTMRERARKLGGTLEIASKPGAGTIVRVNIPKLSHREEKSDVINESGK